VTKEKHRDSADKDHRAGQTALRLLDILGRLHLLSDLLQKVESPPDGKVEEGEHNKGQKAGQADPSPG